MPGEQSNHSLISEISLDFTKAKQNVDGFGAEVDETSQKFDRLSESVKSANLSIADKVANELAKLKQTNSKIDGGSLMKSIENQIAEAITSREIELTNLGEKRPFQVKFTKQRWNQLVNSINKELQRALVPTEVEQKKILEEARQAFISNKKKRTGDIQKIKAQLDNYGKTYAEAINKADELFSQDIDDFYNTVKDRDGLQRNTPELPELKARLQKLYDSFEDIPDDLMGQLDAFLAEIDSSTNELDEFPVYQELKAVFKTRAQLAQEITNAKMNDTVDKEAVKFMEKLEEAFKTEPILKNVDKFQSIKIPANTLRELHGKIQSEIHKLVDNADLKFNYKENELQGLKFSNKDMAQVMNTVRHKFVEHLSDPYNIHFEGLGQLDLKPENLQEIVNKIGDSLGTVESHLHLTKEAIRELPEVKTKLDNFRQSIVSIINNIKNLDTEFSSFNLDSSKKEMVELSKKLQGFRFDLVKEMTELVDVAKRVISETPMSTMNSSEMLGSLATLDTVVEGSIKKKLDDAVTSIMKSLGTHKVSVDGKDVYAPSITALEEQIMLATREALKNIDKGNFNIDTAKIYQSMSTINDKIASKLKHAVDDAVIDISSGFVATNKIVVNSFKQTLNNIAQELNKQLPNQLDSKGLSTLVANRVAEIQKTVIPHLESQLKEILKGAKFVPTVDGTKKDNVVTIPKYVTDRINTVIKQLVDSQAHELANRISKSKNVDFSNTNIQKLEKTIKRNSNKIVSNVIDSAELAINSLVSSVGTDSVKSISKEERARLNKLANVKVGQMLNNFVRALEESVGAFSQISTAFDSLEDGVLDRVNALLNRVMATSTKTDDANLTQLHTAVEDIFDKIGDSAKAVIQQWNPVESYSPSELHTKLNNLFSMVVGDIEDGLLTVFSGWSPSQVTSEAEEFSAKAREMIRVLQDRVFDHAVNSMDVSAIISSISEGGEYSYETSDIIQDLRTAQHKLIQEAFIKPMKQVADVIISEALKSDEFLNDPQVQQVVNAVREGMSEVLRSQLTAYSSVFQGLQNQIVIKTSQLHKEVRKRLAQDADMTVKEFRKMYPTMNGEEGLETVMRKSMEVIQGGFYDTLMKETNKSIKQFKESLSKVELDPDLSAVSYLVKQLTNIQDEITKKIRQVLREQFKAMTEEIKGMRLYSRSIGYEPPKYVRQSLAPSPQRTSTPSVGRRDLANRSSYTPQQRSKWVNQKNPGGTTATWAGSVRNTMRYMTAGAIMGSPIMLAHQGYQTYKDVDYNMEKARQNIIRKDPEMRAVSIDRVTKNYDTKGMTKAEIERLIAKEATELRYMARDGALKYIQDLTLMFNQDFAEMSEAYHISSRAMNDPFEALALTQSIAKLKATEEVDIDTASKGLEGIRAQWGLSGQDTNQVANMLIKTALQSQVTVEDLLDAQKKSGAIFRDALPTIGRTTDPETGEVYIDKGKGLATSFALQSMFTQSTSRTGSEAGTFFRQLLNRPFSSTGRRALEDLSQNSGFEQLNPWKEVDGRQVRKDFNEMFIDIMESSMKMDDPSKLKMFNALFPTRSQGGATAMMNLLESMQEDVKSATENMQKLGLIDPNRDPEDVSLDEAFNKYVENISEVDDTAIQKYLAGLQDTQTFRENRMKGAWDVASFEIMDSIQTDLSTGMVYVQQALTALGNNASMFVEAVKRMTKAMLYAYGYRRAREGLSNFKQRRQDNRRKEYLQEFMPYAESKMSKLQDKQIFYSNQKEKRHALHSQMIGRKEEVGRELNEAKAKYNSMRREQDPSEVARMYGKSSKEVSSWDDIDKPIERMLLDDLATRHLDPEALRRRGYHGVNFNVPVGGGRQSVVWDTSDVKFANQGEGIEDDNYYKKTHLTTQAGAEGIMNEGFKTFDSDDPRKLYRDDNVFGRGLYVADADDDVWGAGAKSRMPDYDSSLDVMIPRDKPMLNINSYEELQAVLEEQLNGDNFALGHGGTQYTSVDEYLRDKKARQKQDWDEDTTYVGGAKARDNMEEVTRPYRLPDDVGTESPELKRQSEEVERLEQSYRGLDSQLNHHEQQVRVADAQEERLTRQMRELDLQMRSAQSGVSVLDLKFEDLERTLVSSGKDLSVLKTTLSRVNSEIKEGKFDTARFETELSSLRRTAGMSENEVEQLRRDVERLNREFKEGTADARRYNRELRNTQRGGNLEGGTNTRSGGGMSKASQYGDWVMALVGLSGIDSVVFDLVEGLTMSKGAKMSIQGDNKERLQERMVNIQDYVRDDRKLSTVFASGGFIWDALIKGGLGNEDFGDYMKVLSVSKEHGGKSRAEYMAELDKALGTSDTQQEAQMVMFEEYRRQSNPFKNHDGTMKATEGETLAVSVQSIKEWLSVESERLQQAFTKNEGDFTRQKVSLLLQGLSEDSEEMRTAMSKYLDKNIEELQRLVDDIKEYLPTLEDGHAKDQLESELSKYEAQISQNELEKQNNEFGAVTEIMKELRDKTSLEEAEKDITKFSHMAGGMDENSATLKALERQSKNKLVDFMEQAQSDLTSQLGKFQGDQREQIWLQIQQLEAEQKKILADIKENTSPSKGTFNIPSGIKPVTEYEAITKGNTHKNVTVRSGDVTVNVNIDSLSGDTKDVEKLSAELNKQINKAQKKNVNQIASDVKSNMGSKYYSIND